MNFTESFQLLLGVLTIIAAVYAIMRRVDVRLSLMAAALILGFVAWKPGPILVKFFETFANERFVVPICTAMGFAYVLRHTKCDQHLVHLLIKPLTRVRWALIPGTVLVAFIVNIPIISQTSTAATLGPVVIPILLAARISPTTIGSTVLLGCSVGGELLNPGAPELRTTVSVSEETLQEQGKEPMGLTGQDVIQRVLPLNLLGLLASTLILWWLSSRAEAKESQAQKDQPKEETVTTEEVEAFRVSYLRAVIPLIPLVLLFVTGPPLNLIHVPPEWLVPHIATLQKDISKLEAKDILHDAEKADLQEMKNEVIRLSGLSGSRLIGTSMLIGVLVAALVAWPSALEIPRAFFDGAGYAFANIVSLIVTASCFAEGIKVIGIAKFIGVVIETIPWLLFPASGLLPMAFGAVCGSGMASTQALFGFFAVPAVQRGVDPALVGSVVSLGSAAGRTMSPVAAVTLMSSTLTNTNPFALAKRVALPLICGVAVIVIAAMIQSSMSG